jgi:hypothetical protein
MKLLVFCGLLVVALAASSHQQWRRTSEPFRAGHEYVYHYKTQISSGIGSTDQHSSQLLSSNVHIHFESERVASLRLQDVKVGVRNDLIAEPRRIQHPRTFEDREIDTELLEQLHMPLRFDHVDGLVEKIYFNEKDSAWSKNIKRAVLNLLQLNLERRTNSINGDFEQVNSMEDDKSSLTRMFTLPETTLEGYCQTIYTINSIETEKDSELFNVTKSIDFNHCKKVAFLRYGPRVETPTFETRTQKLEKIEADKQQQLDRSTVFTYQLTGTPENYGLGRVEVISQYVYKLWNAESQQPMQTIVVGELTLSSSERKSNPREIKVSHKDEDLIYSLEWDNLERRFYQYGDEEFSAQQTPFARVHNKVQMIVKLIQEIAQNSWDSVEGINSQSSYRVHEVSELLRMCTLRDLENIAEKLEKDQQRLFHDVLAIAGTRNTIKFIVEKSIKGEIPVSKTVQILRQLNGLYIISRNQVDDILTLCKSKVAEQSSMLRQSCWLTFGSMVSELCRESSLTMAKESQEQCPITVQEKYHNLMITEYREAETTYEKVLALKTIGNAALHQSVKELERIIVDQTENPIVRQQAIDALRRYRNVMPRKVQRVLLPVFKNVQERPEIRMTAFSMIMSTIPEKSILDQVTFALFKERSQHVRSFVYSTLLTYSKSSVEAERELAQHLQGVLRLTKVNEDELRMSRFYRIPIYSQEQREGLLLNMAAGFASSNMFPQHLSLSMDSLFNGLLEQKNLEFTMNQNNLEQFLYKIYEKNARSILRADRRSTTENGRELLEDVFNTLKIKRSESKSAFGMMSLRVRDIDYVILPLSEETFPEMLKDMSLSDIIEAIRERRNFRFNTLVSLHERVMKIATVAGLPLRMVHALPIVASAEGQTHVTVQDGKAKINLQLKPMINGIHTQKMELWSPFVNTGVESVHKVALNWPIKMHLTASLNSEEKVKLSFTLPEEKVRLAEISSLPLTFIREYDSKTQLHSEAKIVTIRNPVMETRFNELKNDEERAITINGYYHKPSTLTYTSLFNIATVTENHITVDFKPISGTPKTLEMTVRGELFKETEKSSHRPEFKSFFENTMSERYANVEDEDMEDMDYENEPETTRRSKFNKYISDTYRANKVYEHNLHAMFKTVGGNTEHKTEVGLKAICDSHMTLCKLSTEVKCSPMEKREWTFKAKSQILAPEYVNDVEELKDNKQNKLAVTFTCEWGYDNEQKINVRVEGERAVPQQWTEQRWQRIFATAFINKYDIEADYKINQQTRNYISRGWTWFKWLNYWNTVNDVTVEGKQGEITTTIVIDPLTRKYVNMTVKTPREFVRFNNIYLPITVKPFALIRPQEKPYEIHSASGLFDKIKDYKRAECRVDGRKIKTFDSVVYKAPLGQCYSVIAKDCVDKTFVVLMKTLDKTTMQKKIKIVTNKDVIEVEPRYESELIVKINGRRVESVEELSQSGIENTEEMVRITLPQGVVVRFDGKQAIVKLSQYYKDSQCGLCGTMNDEEHDDFRMSDDTITDDVKEFHRSYSMLKGGDEDCEVHENRKLYDDDSLFERQMTRSSSDDDDQYDSGLELDDEVMTYKHFDRKSDRDEEDEESRPIMKTKVIEYNHKLCFSLRAVKQCPRGSFAEDTEKSKVPFTCLNRSSPQTRRLLRQARSQDITSQLGSFKQSIVESVKVATSCSQQ